MHPAPSLIAFSTLSGLGFGLLAMLGLGLGPQTGWVGAVFWALGFGLAAAGLLSSTLHLRRPDRAHLAFREWRSSWLSREAWLAVGALGVLGLFAVPAIAGLVLVPLGWMGAALALGTVGATSMIYAQLRTVPRWHHWSVPALFLGYALTGGTLLAGHGREAAGLMAAMGVAQFLAWRAGDARVAAHGTTSETATGLPARVRLLEAPHSGESYVTREMAFRVARKHATKLRSIALFLAFILPATLLVLPVAKHVLAAFAFLSHAAGVATARWLFFAEAEHVVGRYFGR